MQFQLKPAFVLLLMFLCAPMLALASTPISDTRPTGWRGDGSGKYPDTTPVLTWERRVITPLSEVRSQVSPAAPDAPAAGLPLLRAKAAFEPTEWLVVGPVDVDRAEKSMEQAVGVDETTAAPNAGDALRKAVWQKTHIDERGVNFFKLFGRITHDSVAYVCTYLYSPRKLDVAIITHGDLGKRRVWINGKTVGETATLDTGWNRLLLKAEVWTNTDSMNVSLRLTVVPGSDVQYESTNIAWTTRMPGPGYGMPILVGDRLFCTAEPNHVICLDKKTGKVLWAHSDALWYAASRIEPAGGPLDAMRPNVEKLETMEAEYVATAANTPADQKQYLVRQNADDDRRRLAQELTDAVKKHNRKYGVELGWGGGNCGPTPCSDGKQIYVWHGETGVLSCFALDGTRIYTAFHNSGPGDEHGVNASPLLCGERVVVIGGRQWLCFDKRTGTLLWSQKYRHSCYGTAALARVGNEDVAIAPDGQIVRVADGSLIQKAFGPYDGEIASAVREGNQFYLIARGGFCQATLPDSFANGALAPITFAISPADLRDAETYPVGSPLVLDGLVYATHSGWTDRHPMLLVIDPATKQIVYRHELPVTPEIHYGPDGAGVAASVALAGGKLFILDNRGTCLVAEPGRTWKPLATNVIEQITRWGRQEITQSTPIFEADRVYYRGEENFYCIAKTAGR